MLEVIKSFPERLHCILLVSTKYLLLILVFSLPCMFGVFAQHPTDPIDRSTFNAVYLEHLVKKKIDSVRAKYSCASLVNDSILYLASKHHSEFMADKDRMTHNEQEYPETGTPQLRAEHFGAKNYQVGENVLVSPFNTIIGSKKGKDFNGKTYNGVASSMVDGWVNSPGHFKNIVTPDYTVTGVSVAMHPTKDKIYATQKFANIAFKYGFEEPTSMFPYSNYTPPPIVSSFDGLESDLLNHAHEWGLKHDKLDQCDACNRIVRSPPHLTLRVDNNRFILRVENSKYIKELIKNKHDGFAVELVVFEDYFCGNPEYYTKPSRRNGQCKINGRVLEPVYRDELYRGYKKRKTNKEIKFLSYIVKADSVPFSERAYNYKLEKFDSEYFEIKLGSVPRDFQGHWNHNLLYLQDKQVCHVDYFTGYCGEIFEDSVFPQDLPMDSTGDYVFKLDQEHLEFTIPFEKNKARYTEDDIAPLIASLKNLDYSIDSIHIRAFSSVEGDSAQNVALQEQRAQSIVDVFQNHQFAEIRTMVQAKSDWEHFYRALNASKQWKPIATLSKSDMREKLLEPGMSDSLEFILQKERRAEIDLYCTIHLVDQNLAYYIEKEYTAYVDSLRMTGNQKNEAEQRAKRRLYLSRLDALYAFTHKMMIVGKVDTALLVSLPVPSYYNALPSFAEKFFLYDYLYPEQFAKNRTWVASKEDMLKILLELGPGQLSQEFQYAYILDQSKRFKKRSDVTREEVQAHFDQLERLKLYYQSNAFAKRNIERINYNLNMILLNYVFLDEPEANQAGAYESINELVDWYLKNDKMNDSTALALGKMAVYYKNTQLGMRIMSPYRAVDEVDAYMLPLGYRHISAGNDSYYAYLIELSQTMDQATWCNLFLSECGLPFQAFDHEGLRDVFCDKCQDKNEFLIELRE